MSEMVEPALNPPLAQGKVRSISRPLSIREQMQRDKAVCAAGPAMAHWKAWRVAAGRIVLLALLALTAACAEDKVPVEVRGYNHMSDWFIMGFSVNGAGGPNLSPESGGGGSVCCLAIPERWKPGMKAHVTWAYDTRQGGPEPPPPQKTEVDIPEYTPQNLGAVQVHFYPDHRIKVVVSRYGIGSPCGPMTEAEKAPWSTRPELIEYYTLGKGKHEPCDGLRGRR